MTTLLLASNNAHKLRELRAALSPLGVDVTTLPNPPDPEETGTTYLANASLKALAFAQWSGMPSLADDSGLSVDALDGAPGVYSARYAGIPSNTERNKAKLLDALTTVPDPERGAAFHCVLALVAPPGDFAQRLSALELPERCTRIDDLPEGYAGIACHGQCRGTILRAEQGDGGFGYDPLFLSDDLGRSFAEVEGSEKASVSHRGRAVELLVEALSE